MEGTIGEMRIVAYDFAPRNWAYCNGQLLAISSNTALFSILGTLYGGDGRTTFGLPDLRGRVPLQQGTGAGLPTFHIGQNTGLENITLNVLEMPMHHHLIDSSQLSGHMNLGCYTDDTGNVDDPTGKYMSLSPANMYAGSADTAMGPSAATIGGSMVMDNTGGNDSHTNIQPFLAMHYVICEYGVFPSRN